MPRIACLHIPRFQIVAQQNHEQLQGKPLALINGKLTVNGYSRARIFMCSQEADKYNILPNMRLAEAKAQCAELILRERDEELYKTTTCKLISQLINYSPKIKVVVPEFILLDASGLAHQGGESRFCHNILKLSSKLGFNDAYISIADSAFAAKVATKINQRRINIILAKEDTKFLHPLSIKFLSLPLEIEDTLLTLGISTLGKLAAIPIAELNKRFCKNNEIIWQPWQLAQGIDDCQPSLPAKEKSFACFLDLGGAVSQFSEITFALKSMLDKLILDLKHHALCIQEITLSLYNDSTKLDERVLPLIQASNKSKFLLEIIRLSINNNPPNREFTAIKLEVSRFTHEAGEQSSINKDQLIQSQLNDKSSKQFSNNESSLLQRFAIRLGKNKIFQAQASNQYLSENAGVWIPITEETLAKENIIPIDLKYLKESGHAPKIYDLVLRPTLPTAEVLVQLSNEKPAAINYKKRWYKIKAITNPEYLSCQWWGNATAKNYYKILVEPLTQKNSIAAHSNNILMLLTYDKLKNNWHIEGIYD